MAISDYQDLQGEAAVAPAALAEATRVLLVEDDPVSLKILMKRISHGGYEVETAADGVEGLEKFDRFKPHLIISDWMMPRMDGRELCTAVKQRVTDGSIYFILLTARDKHEDIVQALDTGADEYLIKPCHGPELMARLRAAERLIHLQNALAVSNRELTRANARINKELQAIRHIQQSLLPQSLPQFEGYRFAAHYQPSTECSGDFYDLLALADGRLGVVIGDVSGHGAPAMVAMALIRMLYRMESPRGLTPAEFLGRINSQMFEHLPTDQYATMFYGLLEPATGRLTYSSAGHPPAALCGPQPGRVAVLSDCEGFPIKLIAPDAAYDNHEVTLAAGQTLLFYTDGLPEAFSETGEMFGFERIRATMEAMGDASPEQLVPRLLEALNAFRGSRSLADDLSLLVLTRD